MAHMIMNIDKARSYIQAGDIYHFPRFARGKVFGNRRYPPPEIATSMTLSISLPGSMTWPPFKRRS